MRILRDSGASLLAMVLVMALVAGIASYTALFLALSRVRRDKVLREQPRARYLAEAGIVWAQAHLWNDPNFSGGPLDVDGDGKTDTVVAVAPLAGANGRRRISATVTY